MRYKRPDTKNALSILQAAQRDMKFTLTMHLTEDSGSTIIRNIHESFRMLGDALLISRGMQSEDHITPLNELLKLKVNTSRPMNVLDNLRRLRHNVNYYGYNPKPEEVKEAVLVAKTMFEPISIAVRKEIEKPK